MSEELQQKLRDQLWEVANKLRGNMSASDFMYFTLGFIFYKYLSEKIEKHANDALVDDEVTFKELWAMEKDEDIEELQEVVKTEWRTSATSLSRTSCSRLSLSALKRKKIYCLCSNAH